MDWQRVAEVAESLRATREVSGLVVAAQRAGDAVEVRAFGQDAAGVALAPGSLLPVASITKLATALCVLCAVAEGRLSLDAPLAETLPEAAAARAGATLRMLLSHTAGLPGDLAPGAAPYAPGLSWETIQPALLAAEPVLPLRQQVLYSNIGFGLAAMAVERACGGRFHERLRRTVLEPLGIEAWLGEEPPRPPGRISGQLGEHRGTPLEPVNSRWYRTLGFPWGGMFSTAAGALALVRAFFDGTLLPAPLRAEAARDQTGGLPGGFTGWLEWESCPWGLGLELRAHKRPHFAPALASPRTGGHVGQTGAYAAWDPDAGLGWALLGTRTMEIWWGRMAEIGSAAYNSRGGAA